MAESNHPEHERLKRLFQESLSTITQSELFKKLSKEKNVVVDALQFQHRDDCIKLLCDHFAPNNTLRQLLGVNKNDFLSECINIIDHAIDTGTTIIIQDSKFMNKNEKYHKIIGISNCFDFCEILKNESKCHMNKNIENYGYDEIFSYIKYKYKEIDSENYNKLINECTHDDKYKYGIVSYAGIGCIDKSYNDKKLWQYFGGSLGTSVALGMGYKFQIVRFVDKKTLHIQNKMSKFYKNHENNKYNQFVKTRKMYDVGNDSIVEKYLITKFGEKEARNKMKKYKLLLSGIILDKRKLDPNGKWTSLDFWKLQLQNNKQMKSKL